MSNETVVQPVSPKKTQMKVLGMPLCLAVSAGAALLLLLVAGGFFLFTGIRYGAAESCLKKQDFKGAARSLSAVASFYADAGQLKVYARAGAEMADGQFDEAKSLFLSLDGFRDAAAMADETDYRRASAMLDAGDYGSASAIFSTLAQAGYKDAKTMVSETAYRKAGALLESGDYDGAAAAFAPLAQQGYKDSETMLSETDYRKAGSLLDKGDYDAAMALFQSLSEKKYKDSADMAKEATYQKALSLYADKYYQRALETMQPLGAYKDSDKQLALIKEALFTQGVGFYEGKNYPLAKQAFSLLPDNKDAEKYLTLIDAQLVTKAQSYSDYAKTKPIFDKIMAMGDFADAKQLSVSDVFLPYRLEGTWSNKDKSFTFKVAFDKSNSVWIVDGGELGVWSFLTGGKYYFMNIFLELVERLSFRFDSANSCIVQIFNDDWYDGPSTFTMTRR